MRGKGLSHCLGGASGARDAKPHAVQVALPVRTTARVSTSTETRLRHLNLVSKGRRQEQETKHWVLYNEAHPETAAASGCFPSSPLLPVGRSYLHKLRSFSTDLGPKF